MVAPVRERGLKLHHQYDKATEYRSRSREGAWIEITIRKISSLLRFVAPVRERGLKFRMLVYNVRNILGRSREGAWIEINE